jgi:hypothetical protein
VEAYRVEDGGDESLLNVGCLLTEQIASSRKIDLFITTAVKFYILQVEL